MKAADIKKNAFSMPLYRPSYPKGPFQFVDREYLIITYETDLSLLENIVPEPLQVTEPLVKFEFIRMPDSSGFGSYTESGQVIPVIFKGKHGTYTHDMYLDDHAPIAAGREIWGFPKKLAYPKLTVQSDTLVGTLDYGNVRIATATMGYKYETLSHQAIINSMTQTNYLLKIIPHVDGSPRICELVAYELSNIVIKGAWSGPGAIELFHHALAPVADLPVKRIVSAVHFISDLTLPYGRVVHDYINL